MFPRLSAEALDNTPLELPMQLQGKQNLLLLSWARNQGAQLETWRAVAQALEHAHPNLRVYQMPVSAPENPLYRWWDSSSLRASEPDHDMLHWTVPLYTNRAALRRTLGLPSHDKLVVALLVDQAGHVLWQAEGPSTPESRAALLAAAGS